MDYHADRFFDHSLMFSRDEKLIALFPANQVDKKLISHQGLTYGSIITDHSMSGMRMLEIFDSLQDYAAKKDIKEISYKAIPHIYHSYPAEEDLYALFRKGATLEQVGISSAIFLGNKLDIQPNKKNGINKAKRADVTIRESNNFDEFFLILNERLQEAHNTVPVHSAEEIKKLHSLFRDNIRLFGAFHKDKMLAGIIVYVSDKVVHAQYIASTEDGRKSRAVDFLITSLIEKFSDEKAYFDFGISTENKGQYLNEGLAKQKEEFGARGIVYQIFNWKLK